MAETTKFLAVDYGAESGRAVVGLFDGKKLELRELHRFPNGPVRVVKSLHWDALRLFSEMLNALGLFAREYGPELDGIGIDTWGVDFALLGRGDVLLGNPYHYRDPRTDDVPDKLFAVVPKREVFECTGIQFMKINTLYQLYAMLLERSPLLDVAERLLMMPDLFNFLLTGRKVCEYSIATTSQIFDTRKGEWAVELIEKLGLPAGILGETVRPGTEVGPLLPELAEQTGLRKAPVIAPGCHDTASAVAAVPATSDDYAYISSGTWSLMGIEIKEPIINDRSFDLNFTNEGGVCDTIRFLKNIMGLWLVQECRRQWEREGESLSYAELTQLAAEAEPFRSIVEPDYSEFMGIGNMPERIAKFCRDTGQPVPETKGQFVRCALESLALKYRWTLERLDELHGQRHSVVHIVGGGTQNTLLCQFTADATQRPVVAGPIEATATGNVLVQAMARGYLGSIEDARQVVRDSFEMVEYAPGDAGPWDEAYERYLKIAEQVEHM